MSRPVACRRSREHTRRGRGREGWRSRAADARVLPSAALGTRRSDAQRAATTRARTSPQRPSTSWSASPDGSPSPRPCARCRSRRRPRGRRSCARPSHAVERRADRPSRATAFASSACAAGAGTHDGRRRGVSLRSTCAAARSARARGAATCARARRSRQSRRRRTERQRVPAAHGDVDTRSTRFEQRPDSRPR